MAMDALQGKVDSVDNQVRQIAVELRGYLDHGITSTRKVKPPGTKAGRDLLQHLLGRIDQIVSTDLAEARRLSISSLPPSPLPPQHIAPLANEPLATSTSTSTSTSSSSPSYDFPGGASPSQSSQPQTHQPTTVPVPQDGSPQQQSKPPPTATTITAPVLQDNNNLATSHESPKQSPLQHPHHSPTAVKLKPGLVTPVTPITPGRGSSGVLSVPGVVGRDVPLPLTYPGSAPPPPCPVAAPVVRPTLFEHSAPLFDCTYQDIHILNEVLFEQCSSHPGVRDRGYFKLQVHNLPPLNVQRMDRPTRDHAQSFYYKADQYGIIKVDTGKKPRFSEPRLPFPSSAKLDWSLEEQKELWNSTAKKPPKGHRPYIIGNPLFDDVELSPGEKLKRRGQVVLEGINTQYVYFNLTGKTITTMHREDAHVRSENLLRSGENKFWCFVKPSSTARLEEAMHRAYPEMQNCSQAVRHLSRHIPPAQLDEWGVEYTLDYCIPGQAVVTEPATYHQVLNLGPNYAVAINLEYQSSPDMPPDYRFCEKSCPDKFAISAKDFEIYRGPTPPEEEPAEQAKAALPSLPHTAESHPGPISPGKQHILPSTQSTDHSPTFQKQRSGNQQRSSTEVAAGLTPTLTPERENQAPEAETGAVSHSPVLAEKVDSHSKPVEAPPVPVAASSTDTHMSGASGFGLPNQMVEHIHSKQQQGNNTGREGSGEYLARNDFMHARDHPQLHSISHSPVLVNYQSLPQHRNPVIPFCAPTQTHTNVPVSSPGNGFPYTPKLLVPKQTMEQPAKTQERHATEVSPAAVDPRLEQAVQFLPPLQHHNAQVPLAQTGSHCAHTLKEFSLRPQSHIDSTHPELKSDRSADMNATSVSNINDSAGKRRKRQSDTPSVKKSQKRQRAEPTPTDDSSQRSAFNHIATLIRGCAVVQVDEVPTGQICTKESFDRLAGLVKDYRHHSRLFSDVGGGMNLVNHVDEGFQGGPDFHEYLSRLSKMKLAEWVEKAREEAGSLATSDDYTDHLLSELEWDESKRHKLHDYLREGKCWKTICGKYEGVLCLMPPKMSDAQFTELALFQSRILAFHSQLDIPFVRRLCEMGKILERAIWSDLELPEFIWEAVDTNALSLNEVYPLLGRFRHIKSNQFDPEKHLGAKPLCWDWNWPADPTSLGPRDKKFCGQCNMTAARGAKSPCACFEKQVPSIPRISDDGSKGTGVRAVGIYKAGSLLGELVGELVPLGTYRATADWTIQFRRPDLDDEPVAEIYTRYAGNWVRKVNHCTAAPSAVFKVMKISGKWRQMLVAVRDIKDGDEITAKYGRGFCKEQPYSVVEGFY